MEVAIFGHVHGANVRNCNLQLDGFTDSDASSPNSRINQDNPRTTTMLVTASIFKAYDIRGIVPSTINEAMAEALGVTDKMEGRP